MKLFKKAILLSLVLFAILSNGQAMDTKSENQQTGTNVKYPGRYFYLPNLQAYFDGLKKTYYYKVNGEWTSSEELPNNYGGYSLYNKTKVPVADFNEENPGEFVAIHKKMFPYNSKGRFPNASISKGVAEN